MHFFTVFLFTAAISIDGFGLGLAYGLRRVKIHVVSLFLIGLATSSSMATAMLCGTVAARILPTSISAKLGAALMIILGCFILRKTYFKDPRQAAANQQAEGHQACKHQTWSFQAFLAKRVQDLDAALKGKVSALTTGTDAINWYEAAVLGLALSVDAFAAGFGAAVSGFNIIQTTLLSGFMQVVFLLLGLWTGAVTGRILDTSRLARFPGWVLLFIGIIRIIR